MRFNSVSSLIVRSAAFCGAVLALTGVLLTCPTSSARAGDGRGGPTTPFQIAKPDLIVSDVLPSYEFVYPTGWVLRKNMLNVQIANIGRRMVPGKAPVGRSKGRRFIDMFSISSVRDRARWGT